MVMQRGSAKTRVGFVLSDKMDKTVIVDVIQIVSHPKLKKPIKGIRSSKHMMRAMNVGLVTRF